jgi:hypothetical protein
MRALNLTLLGLSGVAVAMIAAPTPASAQPSALALSYGQKAGVVGDVGYRYRRYRYGGYRPYYRPYYGYGYGYRPYYRPYYGYGYRPYYRPYYGYGYGYGYPYYRRPGFGLWFGF